MINTDRLARECQALAPSERDAKCSEIYQQLKGRAYQTCLRITGNASDASDALQDTFEIVFRRIDKFRFESKFTTWVTVIAMNCSIDLYRRGARHVNLFRADDDQVDPLQRVCDETVDFPSRAAERHELAGHVQVGVLQLPPKLRLVASLRYFKGLSYSEIGTVLGLPLGTVKSRLSRAHEVLSNTLGWMRTQIA